MQYCQPLLPLSHWKAYFVIAQCYFIAENSWLLEPASCCDLELLEEPGDKRSHLRRWGCAHQTFNLIGFWFFSLSLSLSLSHTYTYTCIISHCQTNLRSPLRWRVRVRVVYPPTGTSPRFHPRICCCPCFSFEQLFTIRWRFNGNSTLHIAFY